MRNFTVFGFHPNIVMSVKLREKNWAACVTAMGKARYVCKSLVGKVTKQWLLGETRQTEL
jgi:hypothetical protein